MRVTLCLVDQGTQSCELGRSGGGVNSRMGVRSLCTVLSSPADKMVRRQ